MKFKNLLVIAIFMLGGIILQAQERPNVPTRSPASNSESLGCVSGNCQNGWGKKNFDHGHYEGFWENGQRNGYGLFDWKDSGKYIGFWVNDGMTGYGLYLGVKKDMVGEYQNGFIQGLGYIVEGDEWEQGRYDSSQLTEAYTFYDNGVTTGCTAGDCQNKYGRFKWSNGDSYTGFWKNGNMYMGTYLFSNGDKYTGQFNSNNQYHGQGRFFFTSGNYYGGEWQYGKYHGKGYYQGQSASEDRIGTWSNGTFIKSL